MKIWTVSQRQRAGHAKAWATRKAKYGPQGASRKGAPGPRHQLGRLVALVWCECHLSEGQIANVLGIDRVAVRHLVDAGIDDIIANPPRGTNGKAMVDSVLDRRR